MSDVILDLFGEPVLADRGPGRPPVVWAKEISDKINMLFACGHKVGDVAAAVGLSAPTLRKVFCHEVRKRQVAALKLRSRQMQRLNAQAEAGNVAAEKALAGMIQAEQVRTTSDRVKARGNADAAAAPALGKKEQALVNARELEGRYAPRAAPQLLIN